MHSFFFSFEKIIFSCGEEVCKTLQILISKANPWLQAASLLRV